MKNFMTALMIGAVLIAGAGMVHAAKCVCQACQCAQCTCPVK